MVNQILAKKQLSLQFQNLFKTGGKVTAEMINLFLTNISVIKDCKSKYDNEISAEVITWMKPE